MLLVLTSAGFGLLESKLELLDEKVAMFGRLTVKRTPLCLNLKLEQRDPRYEIGIDRPDLAGFGLGVRHRRTELRNIAGWHTCHGPLK